MSPATEKRVGTNARPFLRRGLHTMSTTAPAPLTSHEEAVNNILLAVDQLNHSERGHLAAVAFRRFLDANDGSAFSLDSNNWRALETLTHACRVHGAFAIRELLPRR